MNAAFWRRMRVQAATLLAVLLAATALTFAVTDILPGDAAVAILGETASAKEVAALRASLGLDRGLGERYVEWLSRAARGELGKSYRTNERISTMIADRLPVTLELIALTQVLALALAVPAGILAAYRSRRLGSSRSATSREIRTGPRTSVWVHCRKVRPWATG